MAIDPRLMDRRREVAEDRARRNVRRLVRFLVVLAVMGAVIWLFLSPLLSVKQVTAAGIVSSSAHSALVDGGVVAGRPMILIRPDDVVADLELDPWVSQADVHLEWPNRVVVRIEERVPAGWVETDAGWSRRAVDGVGLPSASEPDDSLAWIQIDGLTESEAGASPAVIGALEFAHGLTEDLRSGARIRVEDNGELWAVVSGFEVRLGRPIEMGAKALSLSALLEEEPEPGSVLTLIAPTHPATSPPADTNQDEEAQP